MLGAVISPEQEALRPRLDALLACTVGVIDWIVDGVTQRLLGGAPAVTEALRRRRIESSPTDKFVEHLLGIHHTRATVDRGRAFIRGIIEFGVGQFFDHCVGVGRESRDVGIHRVEQCAT
ncbi:MAG: zinc-dependent metalloprotease [Actinomycetota bacterium]